LIKQEKQLRLSKIEYEQFVYLIKRYSYKGTPLQEQMIEEICPELGIDYGNICDEKADKSSNIY
jgi:hypothetical protein